MYSLRSRRLLISQMFIDNIEELSVLVCYACFERLHRLIAPISPVGPRRLTIVFCSRISGQLE